MQFLSLSRRLQLASVVSQQKVIWGADVGMMLYMSSFEGHRGQWKTSRYAKTNERLNGKAWGI